MKPLSLTTVVRLSRLELVDDKVIPSRSLEMSDKDLTLEPDDEVDSAYPEEEEAEDALLMDDERLKVCASGTAPAGGATVF